MWYVDSVSNGSYPKKQSTFSVENDDKPLDLEDSTCEPSLAL